MLSPAEWLARVGFGAGNPFALKWAEEERDRLHEYFVDHHAYHAIIDAGVVRSTILHAPRGAGKSSTRRMFEAHCQAQAPHQSALLLPLTDWMPLVERVGNAPVGPRDLLAELLRLFVVALAELPEIPGTPLPPDEAGYLRWMSATYGDYLRPSQRATLRERAWLLDTEAPGTLAAYQLDGLPVLRCFALLVQIGAALGCVPCYVVVDGIDELCETSADWATGATLLAPLLGNLRMLEVPGLAFKCFIPSGVVAVLRERRLLREDRIATLELSWSACQLEHLLRQRLLAFSEGAVQSLAQIAAPELPNIDQQLCAAAAGSPRTLLSLGDWLIQACARTASDNELLLRPLHLQMALDACGARMPAIGIAPLRITADGTIWLGERMLDVSRRLTPLQRRLLDYLYDHHGRLCSSDELIANVWPAEAAPNDKDSLRRLADRLIDLIEPDPRQPVYIERRHGGFYVLNHVG
ncbi:MAG: winged helix family transcriptional regulator [Candidatus Viridilinea halotolerans]|uniref:Winged helix family transcriptional regulator n=1 Tax=Candidatus Viridilinea halotolerans TaxID=2491704 RepID=A0A426U9H0_9CHLR|nr:MAG: winged helix family transcriptional regulator [Candidatus Viridilinea halotolerans]